MTAKVRSFSELPNFSGSFFFFLPGPSPWRAVRVTFPLESGCKSSAVKHNFQTFPPLFSKIFWGEIDNQVLISDVSHKLFFQFVSARPGPFLGKYRDRRAEAIPVPCGKDSNPSRKVLQYFPKKTGVLSEEDWKRICLILIQVDTFMSNNKMCFDYGKEEKSSKNK